MQQLKLLLLFFFYLAISSLPLQAAIRYVKPVAAGLADGSSWANAAADLQAMINASAAGDEVWAATGTYKPTSGTDRNISFVMKNGVAIYGGFPGIPGQEGNFSVRNWQDFPSILSGDLNGNDVITGSGLSLQIMNDSDNSYHVINNAFTMAAPLTTSAVLDGFTITGGSATNFTAGYNGGGMYNIYASPTLNNVRFEGNFSLQAGGGMYNTLGASPHLHNVIFARNIANGVNSGGGGGGIFNWPGSAPVLNNVHFSGNLCYGSFGGGGVGNYQTSPTFNNCSFTGNYSFPGGGGAANVESNATYKNCLFAANGTNFNGGAVFNQFTTPVFTNCTFYGNTGQNTGGMHNNSGAIPVIRNCIMWGNTGNISKTFDGSATATYSILEGNLYPGTGNSNTMPTFANTGNPIGPDNQWGTADDGLRLQLCSAGLNQGDNANLPATDFAGNTRIFNSTVDMGAYELQEVSGAFQTYYQDQDNDTYGNPATAMDACVPIPGYVTNGSDCDDNNPSINVSMNWYLDGDGDGFGDGAPIFDCQAPGPDYVLRNGDCDDANDAIHPNATEVCDGVDNNCNTLTDEGVLLTFYLDADGDGFGESSNSQLACSAPMGFVADNTDCNDDDPLEKPDQVWYKDIDGDNYAETGAATITQCTRPNGYKAGSELSATTGDCNDNDATIHPGTIWYQDTDGDGYSNGATLMQCAQPNGYALAIALTATTGDCDDNDPDINPTTIWYKDTDGDGYSDGQTLVQCAQPVGYERAIYLTTIGGDCDDDNDNVYPGGTEICDNLDNNCDTQIDEGLNCCPATNILYVNDDAVGNNNGTSWTNAFTDLQDALALAGNCNNVTEIWVAEGTYKPTSGTDRNISFSMKNGVAIYGGFPDGGNPGLNDRDWAAYATILSGDIGTLNNNSDNTRRIISNSGLNSSAVLDGFVIQDASNDGGYSPSGIGAGIYNSNSRVTILNCIVQNNSAGKGGVGEVENSATTYKNCLFLNNTALIGGAFFVERSNPVFTNCTVYGNSAELYGGAFGNNLPGGSVLKNCIIWGNTASSFNPIWNNQGASTTATYSIIQGGYSGTGNLNEDPLFLDATNGDLRLQPCSPAIDAGTSSGAPSNDLDGNLRPVNNGIDMGAYEFQDAPTPVVAACQEQTVHLGTDGSVFLHASALDDGSTGCGTLVFTVDNASMLNYNCSNLGPHTVTLTVTDERGQTASCSTTVTVEDNSIPSVSCSPDVTIYTSAGGTGDCFANYEIRYTLSDNCGSSISANEYVVNSDGSVLRDVTLQLAQYNVVSAIGLPVGDNTISITPTDGSSNEGVACSFTVTVVDDEAPMATCQNVMIQLDHTGSGSTTAEAVNSGSYDNCGVASLALSQTAFDCSHLGDNTVTLTVTDINGNPATCQAIVSVLGEVSASTIWYLDADNDGYYTGNGIMQCTSPGPGYRYEGLSGDDDCNDNNDEEFPGQTWYIDADGDTYGGSTMINCERPEYGFLLSELNGTGTDDCEDGDATINPSAIEVCDGIDNDCDGFFDGDDPDYIDNTMPSLTCPANIDLPMDDGLCGAVVTWTAPTAIDNCDANLVPTQSLGLTSGSFFGEGTQTIEYSATDAAGNTGTCSFSVTVQPDAEMPSLTCPANIDLPMDDGLCGAVVSWTNPTVIDNCDVNLVPTQSLGQTSGSFFSEGTQTIEYSATDAAGNTGTCSFSVTVQPDAEMPSLTCPANIDLPMDEGFCGAVVSWINPTATDNCDVNLVPNQSLGQTSGSFFGEGTQTIQYSVSDAAGNATSCSFTITVQPNTIPPSISCPADITVECGEATEPTATGEATASTICGVPTVTWTDDFSAACGNTGVITRTWTATDQDGLMSTCEQVITIVDTQAPSITGPLANGATIDMECNLLDPNWTAFEDITADLLLEDACTAAEDITLAYEEELIEEGICGVSDFLSLWRRSWTATDACGNSSTYTFFVRIIDTQGPAWTYFPTDVEIACTDNVPFQQATAEDGCSTTEVSYEDEIIPGDCAGSYTVRRRWTAADGCGNATINDQLIHVDDHTAPQIRLIDEYVSNYSDGQEVYVDCGQYGKIIELAYAARAVDDCSGEAEVIFTYEDFGLFNCAEFGYIGHLTTTWSSTDDCGNSSTVSLNWYLTDNTAPTFQGVPTDACASTLPPVPTVTAVDDCEFAVVEFYASDPIDCEGGQYVERTWTATDVCGNTTSYTQRITLTSGAEPSITVDYPGLQGLPSGSTAILEADCVEDGEVAVPNLRSYVVVNGGCSAASASTDLILLQEGECATDGFLARYALRISARDICGNIGEYELFIEFVDTTPPSISGPAELTVSCGEDIPTVSAIDGCNRNPSLDFVDSDPIEASCPDSPRSYERHWTATDKCGNTSTFTQLVTVLDDQGPVLYNVPADACNNLILTSPVTAYDECSGTTVPVSMTQTTANVNGCGQVLTRTWSASDACGNVSTATQQVFFIDNQAPRLSFAHPLLVGLEDGDELVLPIRFEFGNPQQPYDFGQNAIAIEDNCAVNLQPTLEIHNLPAEDCAAFGYLGQLILRWSVVDPCGNESSISLTVLYEDTYGPDIFGVPNDLTIYCEDPIPAPAAVWVKDDYDTDVVTVFTEQYVDIEQGLRLVRTWTATDDCGNTTVATQYIDIVDNMLDYTFSNHEWVNCNSSQNRIGIQVEGGTAPYTYSWEMTGGAGFITSDPTRAMVRFSMGYSTQHFTVTVTDVNGCQRVCTTSVSCQSGTNTLSLQGGGGQNLNDFQLYPNPSDDYTILRTAEAAEEIATVTIYSMLGQEVFCQQMTYWPVEGLRLDTSHYPEGTYILRIDLKGQEPITKKVVVQHR
ncbi:HYR domain-containing protein [Lewinella sp. LCG006]|uniref:HYR domain-containing protein n=1 Tax=Lewinella sp. LCG006 TaxID=3231911 RepID=UPI0034603371